MRWIVMVVVGLAAGCAQTAWVKDGASEQDFARDSYECERDVRQSGYYGGQPLVAAGFYNRCMGAHGYRRERVDAPNNYDARQQADVQARTAASTACGSSAEVAKFKDYPSCFYAHYNAQ